MIATRTGKRRYEERMELALSEEGEEKTRRRVERLDDAWNDELASQANAATATLVALLLGPLLSRGLHALPALIGLYLLRNAAQRR